MRNLATQFCRDVRLTGGLLADRAQVVREQVIPYQWRALNDEVPGAEPSYAIENLRIAAGEKSGKFQGMIFQDSDVAKWLEAVAYSLMAEPDPELEARADEVIDLVGRAQQDDGYINSYYTIMAPDKRWTNLRDNHELYCAGHFIEAAVAYYEATGKDKLLQILCRFVDHIDEVFGPEEGKKRGYPGHEEIELALIKLYRVTKDPKHLRLAQFFIEERGREPHYFDIEAEARGAKPEDYWFSGHWYSQSHLPLREQETAEGHSVRAMYLYSAAADLALETDDKELYEVCKRLWDNVVHKRMYITGGIGSQAHHEGFTIDYDLPGDRAYTETCAAIGLVFWAQRMLQIEPKSEYADVMERALYNGVLSGMSLEGTKFFYVNPLEVDPATAAARHDHRHVRTTRQEWFGCACCPPNIARLLASINQYIYSTRDRDIFVHLFAQSEASFKLGDPEVKLSQNTNYPWDETVQFVVSSAEPQMFALNVRLPKWCRAPQIKVNGEIIERLQVVDGYARIERIWSDGDQVELIFPMPVEKVWANPKVSYSAGKMALQRGPVVYCFEEVDNGRNLSEIYIPADAAFSVEEEKQLKMPVLIGHGYRRVVPDDSLYTTTPPEVKEVELKAVPYFAWDNRQAGEMRVWMNES